MKHIASTGCNNAAPLFYYVIPAGFFYESATMNPIETAPKDGRHVLLLYFVYKELFWIQGWYQEGGWHTMELESLGCGNPAPEHDEPIGWMETPEIPRDLEIKILEEQFEYYNREISFHLDHCNRNNELMNPDFWMLPKREAIKKRLTELQAV